MNSLTEENYLKAIFGIAQYKSDVTANDIAKHLSITMPTVTSMMKKLAVKKLVTYSAYKPIKLTAKGRKEAALIIRKHRLTEMFLVKVMGFGWEDVHSIAEEIEHVNSTSFFEKMDLMLGSPTHDPHGSVIPDRNGNIPDVPALLLSTISQGKRCVVRAVVNSSSELLSYLTKCDIHLGSELTVDSVEPFDGTMNIYIHEKKIRRLLILSKTVCEHLSVEVVR